MPALVEIEEALAPAFVIETLDDGRLTVFVPSVPTPFAGAVYVLRPERVHILNVPLHSSHQVHLSLGFRIERSRGSHA